MRLSEKKMQMFLAFFFSYVDDVNLLLPLQFTRFSSSLNSAPMISLGFGGLCSLDLFCVNTLRAMVLSLGARSRLMHHFVEKLCAIADVNG